MSREIPLFVITHIPAGHCLFNLCIAGNLDGDERYRKNTFDSEHSLDNFWLLPLSSSIYPSIECLNLESRSDYLPSDLIPLVPLSLGRHTTTSCYVNYSAMIHLDSRVPRLGRELYLKQKHQLESRLDLLETLALCPGTVKLLQVETDRHPLLDVIGTRDGQDNKMETWEEMYDEGQEAYYPRKLGRSRAKE
jgi:hypothetical protein